MDFPRREPATRRVYVLLFYFVIVQAGLFFLVQRISPLRAFPAPSERSVAGPPGRLLSVGWAGLFQLWGPQVFVQAGGVFLQQLPATFQVALFGFEVADGEAERELVVQFSV